jgi:hypothetical protein
MINDNQQNNQLPKELKSVFGELEISKHLRNAGIKKKFGFSAAYLFQPELFTENQKLIITSGLPSLFSFIVLHEKNEKRVHFC